MKKIIITESQTRSIINELFSQKLMQQLIDKFQSEIPNLPEQTIHHYLERFQQIKDSPKVKEKDITKYSWKKLEEIVDSNQPKSIDKNIKINNSDLIYNQNKLKIYRANSKQACIKYGNGYNFCISSRGNENQYTNYRLIWKNTIYFVFDEERTKEMLPNNKFVDPKHLLVIMIQRRSYDINLDAGKKYQSNYEPSYEYHITTANNDGETKFKNWKNVEKYQPKLTGLKDLFMITELSDEDKLEQLKMDYTMKLNTYTRDLSQSKEKIPFAITGLNKLDMINDILERNAQPKIYAAVNPYLMGTETRTDNIDPYKWKMKQFKKYFAKNDIEAFHVKILPIKITPHLIEYLKGARKIILEYLHKLNEMKYKLGSPSET